MSKMTEEELIDLAQNNPDDTIANNAMKELRERFVKHTVGV